MDRIKDNVNELTNLIIEYRYEEALDKFYDETIATHENDNAPLVGLAAYKEAARKVFYDNVSNYSAELLHVTIFQDISACQWHYRFDHKLWGKWDKIQLSVQR
jgi:hypothetical protein